MTTCPRCKGPVGVMYLTMKHTDGLIRKETCSDAKCAVRVFSRVPMAKREVGDGKTVVGV